MWGFLYSSAGEESSSREPLPVSAQISTRIVGQISNVRQGRLIVVSIVPVGVSIDREQL